MYAWAHRHEASQMHFRQMWEATPRLAMMTVRSRAKCHRSLLVQLYVALVTCPLRSPYLVLKWAQLKDESLAPQPVECSRQNRSGPRLLRHVMDHSSSCMPALRFPCSLGLFESENAQNTKDCRNNRYLLCNDLRSDSETILLLLRQSPKFQEGVNSSSPLRKCEIICNHYYNFNIVLNAQNKDVPVRIALPTQLGTGSFPDLRKHNKP